MLHLTTISLFASVITATLQAVEEVTPVRRAGATLIAATSLHFRYFSFLKGGNKYDKFKDAYESIPAATTMDLISSLEECTTRLYLFLNNRFSDAIHLIYPWSKNSVYPARIYGILTVIKAFLTFDPQEIEIGMTATKEALRTCNSFRRKSRMMSFSRLVNKQGINAIKEEELHAEVCYAECLILKSTVTFIQDDSVLRFLKSGINVGLSCQIYKDCQRVLTQIPNYQSKTYRHLVGGIKFGLGVFNLILSLVPPKTLKLLNVVGYSGNREVGLTLLHDSASESHTNNILSVLTLFFYYISVAFGVEKSHSSAAENLSLIYLQKFPNCVILQFFHARFSMLKGYFKHAQLTLEECIFIQNEWKQVHHLCYWKLMWCHSFLLDWKQAYRSAELRFQHSRWSKAMYSFAKASLLAVLPSDFVKSVSEDMSSLFLNVDNLRIRILGTSVPIEKFVAEKGQRYATTAGWFTAQPILELMYAWSGFRVMSKNLELISTWLSIIDKGGELLQENPSKEYGTDDINFLNFLKGLCLKYLDYASAIKNLENIKHYKDYSVEARLQFRAHIALEQIAKEK
uniref:Tetratricopeptide repeat protein 39B n=1 Tax=Monodon monoceros TaxID=40151 RepID=A0A8C6BPK6_MONMO